MGSKKRSKVKVDEAASKRRGMEQLRVLFDTSDVKTPPPIQIPNATQTEMPTLTPTPTVKTGSSNLVAREKPGSVVYEKSLVNPPEPLRTVISANPYRAAKRVDVREKEVEEKTEWWLGPTLILAALLLLGIGWLHIERSGTIANPVGHSTSTLEAVRRESQEKVEFYRRQLGHRLNRDRVNVEIQNSRLAPVIEPGAVRQHDRSMMSGAPLMQESYVERNYGRTARDTQPVPIDRPDARIQYGLQEEQHRGEFDRRVQKNYIDEFVENARREGVRVILDDDANVIDVKPLSESERSSESRRPGSADPNVAK